MAELEQRESQTQIAQEVQNQVTSTTPATKPAKNPKRVAAGKLVAEKTKQAREAQKKAAVEAAAIIAKEKEKKSASAKRNVTPPVTEAQPQSSGLTTNQLISLLGIGVAIITTYVKREDIKAFFNRKSVEGDPEPEGLSDSQVTPEIAARVENSVRERVPTHPVASRIPQPTSQNGLIPKGSQRGIHSLRDDFIETSSGVEEYKEDNQQEEARERQRVYNEGYNAGIESTKKVAAGAA
ncbi:hypothetical protein ACROYT_G026376 [Oculina patagonica]